MRNSFIGLPWMTIFGPPLQEAGGQLGIPWWVWLVVVLVLLLLLMIGLVSQEEPGPPLPPGGVKPRPSVTGREGRAQRPAAAAPSPASAQTAPVEPEAVSVAESRVAAQAAPQPSQPDDLKRIEGIGPKIASLLHEAGIITFTQLAETDTARLEQILDGAELQFSDPGTWPEQARLAAAGHWDELEKLQNDLKGGRGT